jgi:hypothetical protein
MSSCYGKTTLIIICEPFFLFISEMDDRTRITDISDLTIHITGPYCDVSQVKDKIFTIEPVVVDSGICVQLFCKFFCCVEVFPRFTFYEFTRGGISNRKAGRNLFRAFQSSFLSLKVTRFLFSRLCSSDIWA